MEQITREEMIGLLLDLQELAAHQKRLDLVKDIASALIALQAAEPVAFRFRSKRLTDEGINPTWIYEEGVPKVHDEILEGCYVEPLFALPCPPAKTNKEESETVGEKLERQLYTAYLKALDDNQEPLARMIERAITLSAPFRKQPAKAQVPDAVIENLARQYGCHTSDGFKGFALAVIEKHEESRLAASPAPNNDKDGCTCQGCGIVYAADLIVPDEWWEKIKPEGKAEGAGLLCPTCIMDRLVEQGWSAGHVIASPAPACQCRTESDEKFGTLIHQCEACESNQVTGRRRQQEEAER